MTSFIQICIIDSSWVQAITGIAALVISIVTALTSKKIREIIALTEEQKKQTKILSQRLEIERKLALPTLIPYFRLQVERPEPAQSDWEYLQFKNIGIEAVDVSIRDLNSDHYNIPGNRTWAVIVHNGMPRVEINFRNGAEKDNVSFSIYFRGNDGNEIYQRVLKQKFKDWLITPPNVDW